MEVWVDNKKCLSKVSLLMRIRAHEVSTIRNFDRLLIQLASMVRCFPPKTISAWNGITLAEAPSLAEFKSKLVN